MERKYTLQHERMLQEKFGITRATYDAMLLEQDNKCYICEEVDAEGQLAVDHDHATGKVRGLLCRQCNRGLGMFKDNPIRLQAALEYLTREYDVPHNDDTIDRLPQEDRPRWRNLVVTPQGTFYSFEDAGKFYDVHPTTIGGWCGIYKGKKREGFSSTRLFKSLTEIKNAK